MIGTVFDGGMRLDHVSYAAPVEHLADTVQRIGSALGATFTDGGLHPRFGTRNFILPLAGGTYLEVVAALDHPAAYSAPFGRAVRARADEGGGWMGWVVSVSDMAKVEARLGRQAVEGHRVRPDGYDLRWQQIGVLDTMADAQLPFFVHWDADGDAPSLGRRPRRAHRTAGHRRVAGHAWPPGWASRLTIPSTRSTSSGSTRTTPPAPAWSPSPS